MGKIKINSTTPKANLCSSMYKDLIKQSMNLNYYFLVHVSGNLLIVIFLYIVVQSSHFTCTESKKMGRSREHSREKVWKLRTAIYIRRLCYSLQRRVTPLLISYHVYVFLSSNTNNDGGKKMNSFPSCL